MIEYTLLQKAPTFLIAIILFLGLIISYLFGFYVRRRIIQKSPNHATVDLVTINGTLLGLLGLLLAFTFSMASSRYDTRRQLTVEEANDIGTVVLRTDIYPDSIRKLLRSNLKEYVDERIAYYEEGMDMEKIAMHFHNAGAISSRIWSIAASYAKTDNITTRTSELIPALNAMMDITTTRRAAGEATIPDSIMYFLFILCFCSAFLLGYDNKNKIDWIVVIGFGIMLSATVFTIVDLDRPRSGFITMKLPIQKMVELRGMFTE